MKRLLNLTITLLLCQSTVFAQESAKGWHFFNQSYLQSSLRHELNFSFFGHVVRSPTVATIYRVSNGIAYPEPVVNRVVGVLSTGYEPRARLVEYNSGFSITLDIPLTFSLSAVDITNPDKLVKYSTEPVTDIQFNNGLYFNERSSSMGICHVEAGALISMNFMQGATIENTRAIGFTLSAGVNRTMAPLLMNFIEGTKRRDYRGMLGWNQLVARGGLQFRGVGFYYMFGVNPENVFYTKHLSLRQDNIFTNIYHRFSMSVRLGR